MDLHPQTQLPSQNSPPIPRSEDSAQDSTTAGNNTEHGSINDSQLIGAPVAVAVDADFPLKLQGNESLVLDVEVKVSEGVMVKRKRGRPPRAYSSCKPPPPPQKKREVAEEEDVCFICFDGGSLVLCDRRGCPKAYHPACIKRDESFFRSKAKWNCGWHICSSCQKTSHYMCYTCTFSSCKGCTKGADYVCVRGNKGFCGICMRTILLIENQAQHSQETVRVDFDDKTSWEYLFKVYWICLKEKLSLTLDEITQAKNPWRGHEYIAHKSEYSDQRKNGVHESHMEVNNWKGSSINDQPKLVNQVDAASMEKSGADKANMEKSGADQDIPLCGGSNMHPGLLMDPVINVKEIAANRRLSLPESVNWASNELLEFVAHMKNGDTSTLSQFDVQALLMEYIKKNNLRDPHRKCEVICDSRLFKLFGKPRVGHFEMLKLLEYHFIVKENAKADELTKKGTCETLATKMRADMSSNNNMMSGHKRRKIRKKARDVGCLVNPDEYAAIDVHNISLIYLRRNLIESLLDHAESLHDKIVGSVVRIKISGNDPKEDLYRLVLVTGTSKVGEPYKVGMRTVGIMLEILNLGKKELISIDEISNQDFSEDECNHLHQSINDGLMKRLTVGDIQQKAKILQESRVNSWLEAELLRLTNLRDRANEKGLRKELIECVEKIELLSSSEERQRRLLDIPEVHVDRTADHPYEPAKAINNKKKDKPTSQNTESSRKRRGPIASRRWNSVLNQVDPASSIIRDLSNQLAVTSGLSSAMTSESALQIQSKEIGKSCNSSEMDRVWHYQDPTGKVQGPFSMLQLRKWSLSGHFPPDLKIWRTNEKQDSSILLTAALNGCCDKEPMPVCNGRSPSQHVRITSDNGGHNKDAGPNSCNITVQRDNKDVDGSQCSLQTDMNSDLNGHVELANSYGGDRHDVKITSYTGDNNWDGGCSSMNAIQKDYQNLDRSQHSIQNDIYHDNSDTNNVRKSTGEGSHSYSWNSPSDVNSCTQQRASLSQGWDSPGGNGASSTQLQVYRSVHSPSVSERHTFLDQRMESKTEEKGQSNANDNLCNTAESQTNSRQSSEKQSDSEGHSGQSSGQNWRPPYVISPSEVWDSGPGIPSVKMSVIMQEQNHEVNVPDLSSHTMKPMNERGVNNEQPASGIPVQDCPSWSTSSTLVGNVSQSSEVAGESRSHCVTAKPSAEDRDRCLASAETRRPAEMLDIHVATPTSGNELSYPLGNSSPWQDMMDGTTEFCPLVEESVSDLLAEVEAMESRKANCPGTPTSTMNCGGDFTEGSRDECFSTIGDFSPGPDELQLTSQSTVTDETHVIFQNNDLVLQKRLREHCSPTVECVSRHGDLVVGELDRHGDTNLPPSTSVLAMSTSVLAMPVTDITERPSSEVTDKRFEPVQESSNLSSGGLPQRNGISGQDTCSTAPERSWASLQGNSGIWGGQMRHGGERVSPRDRGFHNGFSSFGRDRSLWNRQTSVGGGIASRHSPKAQRICKFYESGCCKKGASCSYLHPEF